MMADEWSEKAQSDRLVERFRNEEPYEVLPPGMCVDQAATAVGIYSNSVWEALAIF